MSDFFCVCEAGAFLLYKKFCIGQREFGNTKEKRKEVFIMEGKMEQLGKKIDQMQNKAAGIAKDMKGEIQEETREWKQEMKESLQNIKNDVKDMGEKIKEKLD